MTFEEQRKKYLEDAVFHTLVDLFYDFFLHQEVSLYEIKDAFTFAMTKFAMDNTFDEIKGERQGFLG